MFISNNEDTLVSMSTTDSNDKKVIPIVDIQDVRYPDINEGIKKFVTEIVPGNYCVIDYSIEGRTKVMELGCHSTKFMVKFIDQLTDFFRKKGISLGG